MTFYVNEVTTDDKYTISTSIKYTIHYYTMEYLHYSARPITLFIDNIPQRNDHFKPTGLWLSEGNAWKEWCEEEGFVTCNMNTCYIYKAKLNMSTIKCIATYDDFVKFEEIYQGKYGINWSKVAKDYDGICFQNYYEVKSEYMSKSQSAKSIWILGIDVNSVCVWNPTHVITQWTVEREGVLMKKLLPTEEFIGHIYKDIHGIVS